MILDQVKKAIEETPKGSNIVVEWVRACKVKKTCTDSITKAVRMVGRIGIDYNNLSAVQTKRENGELPSTPQPLPWGQWAIFPWLIEHKDKYYLRLYNGTSSIIKPEVHFFNNGVETTLEAISPVLLASEKDKEHGDCFCCKVEDMTRIHCESEWVMLVEAKMGQEKIVTEESVPAKVIATIQ